MRVTMLGLIVLFFFPFFFLWSLQKKKDPCGLRLLICNTGASGWWNTIYRSRGQRRATQESWTHPCIQPCNIQGFQVLHLRKMLKNQSKGLRRRTRATRLLYKVESQWISSSSYERLLGTIRDQALFHALRGEQTTPCCHGRYIYQGVASTPLG